MSLSWAIPWGVMVEVFWHDARLLLLAKPSLLWFTGFTVLTIFVPASLVSKLPVSVALTVSVPISTPGAVSSVVAAVVLPLYSLLAAVIVDDRASGVMLAVVVCPAARL